MFCEICGDKTKFDEEHQQYYCNTCGWWFCV